MPSTHQSGRRVAGQLARFRVYGAGVPHLDLAGGADAEQAVVVAADGHSDVRALACRVDVRRLVAGVHGECRDEIRDRLRRAWCVRKAGGVLP